MNLFAGGGFEILQELPKCDTETQSKQMLLENGTNRHPRHRVPAILQFVKNAVSMKCNKARMIKQGMP